MLESLRYAVQRVEAALRTQAIFKRCWLGSIQLTVGIFRFLIFVQPSPETEVEAAIPSATIEIALAMSNVVEIDIVKWDEKNGQLGYLDQADLDSVFGTKLMRGRISPNKACHRQRFRFSDTLERPINTWILLPEFASHIPNRNEVLARIISQCREYGVRCAAVIHDLPEMGERSSSQRQFQLIEYLLELTRADLIAPVSSSVEQRLIDFYSSIERAPKSDRGSIYSRIKSMRLGEHRDSRLDVPTPAEAVPQRRPEQQVRTERLNLWEECARGIKDICTDSMNSVEQRRELATRQFNDAFDRAEPGGISRCAVGRMEWGAVEIGTGAKPDMNSGSWPPADRANASRGVGVIVSEAPKNIGDLPSSALQRIFDADVLGLHSKEAYLEIVHLANDREFVGLLPSRIVVDEDLRRLRNAVSDAMADIACRSLHYLDVAEREGQLGAMAASLHSPCELGACQLAVVISTYNRGPFIELNVEWLLELAAKFADPIRVVVVDNASTDDTADRLKRFRSNPQFEYVRNAENVGMLGNLQVCSALKVARYVWLIGDDDFIIPGAIDRVLEILRRHPRIPLIAHNFKIYWREGLSEGDSVQRFLSEMKPIAPPELVPEPTPSGVRSVNKMAAEHDNLFTAIYPLVFRSDILAATFNYPFDGIPFATLVDCVPTTKLILETLRYCEIYWVAEHGIVGNLHNSWAHHKPRWHLVNMAQVFDLARSAGVDQERIWTWAKWHADMFDDAVDVARASNATVHLDLPQDVNEAMRIYRISARIPSDLRIWKGHAEVAR